MRVFFGFGVGWLGFLRVGEDGGEGWVVVRVLEERRFERGRRRGLGS